VGSYFCCLDRNRTRHATIWSKSVYDSWGSSPIFRYVYSQELLAALRNDDFDGVDFDLLSETGPLAAKDSVLKISGFEAKYRIWENGASTYIHGKGFPALSDPVL